MKRINAGIPQGCILGPRLNIIFIDDISQDLENQSIRYADDDTIMFFVKSREVRPRFVSQSELSQDRVMDYPACLMLLNAK